ncbi:MAG: hypothetical protein J5724_03155 [Ruminococcus sp.]|nr:hypothetical protein [Ruminococcus sp.]
MKKAIISLMAFTAMLCTFTSCGNNEISNPNATTTVTNQTTTEIITTSDTSIVPTETTSNEMSPEETAEYMDRVAKLISQAENMALVEMEDIEKLPMPGYAFIISFDGSKDYNVPDDFDIEDFKNRTNSFFEEGKSDYKFDYDLNELEWFSVIYGDYSLCSTVKSSDTADIVGTGPTYNNVITGYDLYQQLSSKITDEMSFGDIYNAFIDVIAK